MCGIILDLLSIPGYYDVALRDLRGDYFLRVGVHRAGLSAGPLSRYTSWQLEQASARVFVASDTFS